MEETQFLDHYRNLYQITKADKDFADKDLETFKLLSTVQADIINSQNKRIEELKHSVAILENQLNENLKDKQW